MKSFSENLKQIRLDRKMTQKEVYTLLEVSPNCYASYEQGRTEPNIDTIKKLCKIFQISADELLDIDIENYI